MDGRAGYERFQEYLAGVLGGDPQAPRNRARRDEFLRGDAAHIAAGLPGDDVREAYQHWLAHFGRGGGPVSDPAPVTPPPQPDPPRISPTATPPAGWGGWLDSHEERSAFSSPSPAPPPPSIPGPGEAPFPPPPSAPRKVHEPFHYTVGADGKRKRVMGARPAKGQIPGVDYGYSTDADGRLRIAPAGSEHGHDLPPTPSIPRTGGIGNALMNRLMGGRGAGGAGRAAAGVGEAAVAGEAVAGARVGMLGGPIGAVAGGLASMMMNRLGRGGKTSNTPPPASPSLQHNKAGYHYVTDEEGRTRRVPGPRTVPPKNGRGGGDNDSGGGGNRWQAIGRGAQHGAHRGASAGNSLVRAVLAGINGAHSLMVAAGTTLVSTLLGGVMSPFGASGHAVAGLGGSAVGALTGIASTGLGLIGQGAHAASSVVGAGMGAVGGIAQAGLSMIPVAGPILGALVGALLGTLIPQVLNGITGLFTGILSVAGTALGGVAKLFGEAMSTIMSVVQDLTQSALRLAGAAMGMSQKSGMSIGAASTAIYNGMGFGLSADKTAGMYSDNLMFQMPVAGVWGVHGDPGSADYLNSMRKSYQAKQAEYGGNPLMANLMLSSMGKSDLMGMANLDDKRFNRQMETSAAMTDAFGMNPDEIKGVNQDLGLLMASFSQFAELLKTRILADLLPTLTAALNTAIQWVKGHAPEISAAIKTGIGWLINTLPPLAMEAGAVVMRGFGFMMVGIGNFTLGIQANLPQILGCLDSMINGFVSFGTIVFKIGRWIAGQLHWILGAFESMTGALAGGDEPFKSHLAKDYSDANGGLAKGLGATGKFLVDQGQSTINRADSLSKFGKAWTGFDMQSGDRQENLLGQLVDSARQTAENTRRTNELIKHSRPAGTVNEVLGAMLEANHRALSRMGA